MFFYNNYSIPFILSANEESLPAKARVVREERFFAGAQNDGEVLDHRRRWLEAFVGIRP